MIESLDPRPFHCIQRTLPETVSMASTTIGAAASAARSGARRKSSTRDGAP